MEKNGSCRSLCKMKSILLQTVAVLFCCALAPLPVVAQDAAPEADATKVTIILVQGSG